LTLRKGAVGKHAEGEHLKARGRSVNDLAGLRARNHIRQIGVTAVRRSGVRQAVGGAFYPPLLLIQLFLLTRLFSPAFVQFVILF
jgi:hypothetical protein